MDRLLAWSFALAATLAAFALTESAPAIVRMTALCSALLLGMKLVVAVEHRRSGGAPLGAARWLAFTFGWPGMRPALFARRGAAPLPDASALVAKGLVRLAAGALLVALGRLAWVETGSRVLATVLVLPGLSLVLQLGVANVLAGAWRAVGFDVGPLFKAPLLATSLGEFWGRRWNLAFSEMVAVAVHRPLAARFGRSAGVAAAFVFSGLAHELAISVPARAGYGLPTLYFLLHGALVLVERRLGWKNPGRVWTLGWLAAPVVLLFHPPFLAAVVWPLAGLTN